ncbi:MAG: CRISPR-associated protein Cas4 [Candidatus Pacearchaeota archaeon]
MRFLNVTEIASYLYCPRKMYIKRIMKIKEKPTPRMIEGKIKHDIFDIFNKNEKEIITRIRKKIGREEILKMYKFEVLKILSEIIKINEEKILKYNINVFELKKNILNKLEREILLRVSSLEEGINKGYFEEKLWENLPRKYYSEIEIISKKLFLKGRIDRVEINDNIIPYEIKNKDRIYEEDKLQLVGYALLLEEKFDRKVNFGFIETKKEEKKIEINDKLKKEFLEILEEIKNVLKEKKSIPIISNFKKCQMCNFKNICFNENSF